MDKICLSWLSKRPALPALILAVIVQACSSGKSNTSNAANGRNINQTETSAVPAQCDPNYSGCVPIASDVDCVGGGGNGPAYVKGPVKVIGKDIYRLDSDGNGIGCETTPGRQGQQ